MRLGGEEGEDCHQFCFCCFNQLPDSKFHPSKIKSKPHAGTLVGEPNWEGLGTFSRETELEDQAIGK